MDHSELTGRIIGCAMKVHSVLGPGLLESTYRICLIHDLKASGLETKTELPLPVVYEGSGWMPATGSTSWSRTRLYWSSKP